MANEPVGGIVKTALITAFTIAAALIWKDVIMNSLALLFPAAQEIYFQVFTAILATVIVITAIYVTVKTEEEAEVVVHRIADKRKKKPAAQSAPAVPAAEAKK
jgi:hypothetical protein